MKDELNEDLDRGAKERLFPSFVESYRRNIEFIMRRAAYEEVFADASAFFRENPGKRYYADWKGK